METITSNRIGFGAQHWRCRRSVGLRNDEVPRNNSLPANIGEVPSFLVNDKMSAKAGNHKTDEKRMKAPSIPTNCAFPNSHNQLHCLIESFVCMVARALLILQEHLEVARANSHTIERGTSGRYKTNRSVNRPPYNIENLDEKSGMYKTRRCIAKEEADKISRPSFFNNFDTTSQSEVFDQLMQELAVALKPKPTNRTITKSSCQAFDPNFIHGRHGCDGCLTSPIVGVRYRAKYIADYDLCTLCFNGVNDPENFQPEQLECDNHFQVKSLNDAGRSVGSNGNIPHGLHPSLLMQAMISKRKSEVAAEKRQMPARENVPTATSAEAANEGIKVDFDSTQTKTSTSESTLNKECPPPMQNDIAKQSTSSAPINTEHDSQSIAASEVKTLTNNPSELTGSSKTPVKRSVYRKQEDRVEDPNVKMEETIENYIIAVGGFVHNCVEGGMTISKQASTSASQAATASKKHVATVASVATVAALESKKHVETVKSHVSVFAKRAALIAAESRKRAEAYAVAAKIAAADAEAKRNALRVAAGEEESKRNAIAAVSAIANEKRRIEGLMHTPTIEIPNETEAKSIRSLDDETERDANTQAKIENVRQVLPKRDVIDEVAEVSIVDSLSPPVLEFDDEASASISLKSSNSTNESNGENGDENLLPNTVEICSVAKPEEIEIQLISEGLLVVDAGDDTPTSVNIVTQADVAFDNDLWNMVDDDSSSTKSSGGNGIAWATVTIGSAMFKEDLTRSAESITIKGYDGSSNEGMTTKRVGESSVLSRSESCSSLASSASSDSSMSMISAISVLSMDSLESSSSVVSDGFEVVDAEDDM